MVVSDCKKCQIEAHKNSISKTPLDRSPMPDRVSRGPFLAHPSPSAPKTRGENLTNSLHMHVDDRSK